MPPLRSLDKRVQKLEDSCSEWDSVLSVRVVNCTGWTKRCYELCEGSRQFWRIKAVRHDPLFPPLRAKQKDIHFQIWVPKSQAWNQTLLHGLTVVPQNELEKAIDIKFRPN